jgi:hypothetical protein
MVAAQRYLYDLEGVNVVWQVDAPGEASSSPLGSLSPGEYADALRALGLFLEQVQAMEIGVTLEGQTLGASWSRVPDRREERRYGPREVDALRTTARLFRGLDESRPPLARVQVLRVLGQQLDEMGAESFAVAETTAGYGLAATTAIGAVHKRYPPAELSVLAEGLRSQRGDAIHPVSQGSMAAPPPAA